MDFVIFRGRIKLLLSSEGSTCSAAEKRMLGARSQELFVKLPLWGRGAQPFVGLATFGFSPT